MLTVRILTMIFFSSVFVSSLLLPPNLFALNSEQRALQIKLIQECKRILRVEKKTCVELEKEEQDPDTFILESCTQEAMKYYGKCVKDAKKEASNTTPKTGGEKEKKEELLKRWTF